MAGVGEYAAPVRLSLRLCTALGYHRFAPSTPIIAALSIALAGCGQVISKPQLVQRDPPPIEMTECQEEPAIPADGFRDESARYAWAAMAIYAGRDCRVRLGALKAWALVGVTQEPGK